jgi:hypothetical protein
MPISNVKDGGFKLVLRNHELFALAENLCEERNRQRKADFEEGRTEEAQRSYWEKIESAVVLKKSGVSCKTIALGLKLPLEIVEAL